MPKRSSLPSLVLTTPRNVGGQSPFTEWGGMGIRAQKTLGSSDPGVFCWIPGVRERGWGRVSRPVGQLVSSGLPATSQPLASGELGPPTPDWLVPPAGPRRIHNPPSAWATSQGVSSEISGSSTSLGVRRWGFESRTPVTCRVTWVDHLTLLSLSSSLKLALITPILQRS